MTRLISVKNASDLPEVFKDKVLFNIVDGNVEGVVLIIRDQVIQIVSKDTYSNTLKVLMREPEDAEPLLDYGYNDPSRLDQMQFH